MERSDWYRLLLGVLCFVTVSLSVWERGLLITVAFVNVTADFISVNGFLPGEEHRRREKAAFFLRYISLSVLRPEKKEQSDYCHTALKSTFFYGNC